MSDRPAPLVFDNELSKPEHEDAVRVSGSGGSGFKPNWGPDPLSEEEARDQALAGKKPKSLKIKSAEIDKLEPRGTVFVPTRGPFCKLCDLPCGWIGNAEIQVIYRTPDGEYCSFECAAEWNRYIEPTVWGARLWAFKAWQTKRMKFDPYYCPRRVA